MPTDSQPTTVNDTIAAQDVPFSVQIAPYGAVVDHESSVTDGLVEISIDNGLASVHDLASTDELDFTDQIFCIGKACPEVTCQHPPSPSSPDRITPIPLTVPFYVAAGGSTQLGTLTMEDVSVPTPDAREPAERRRSVRSRRPQAARTRRLLRRGPPHPDPQRRLVRLPGGGGVHPGPLGQWQRRRAGAG